MPKKTLYSVRVKYKPNNHDSSLIDKFFAYAFSPCHALNCVLRKLSEEYGEGFVLLRHEIIHVYNFVL